MKSPQSLKTPPSLLPDSPTLTVRLTAALNGSGHSSRPVEVLDRTVPPEMHTFPNEVVTCRLPDGRLCRVFIKYEGGRGHVSYGHRGNLAYEAEVYRRVLAALPDFRPKYFGAHTNEKTGETWLMLEYADRSVRVPRASMADAAVWIARFHAVHESRLGSGALSFLIRYDADYYHGWAHRTAEFARPLFTRFPWLKGLCERSQAWSAPLLAARQSVIHGEFYTEQILLRRRKLFILDWESAAIGAGEIDLATLTEGEGWAPALVSRCEREYQRARWGGRSPSDFHRTLDAARIYLHFRWLGERPDWTLEEKSFWRYRHLRRAAKRLGLL